MAEVEDLELDGEQVERLAHLGIDHAVARLDVDVLAVVEIRESALVSVLVAGGAAGAQALRLGFTQGMTLALVKR